MENKKTTGTSMKIVIGVVGALIVGVVILAVIQSNGGSKRCEVVNIPSVDVAECRDIHIVSSFAEACSSASEHSQLKCDDVWCCTTSIGYSCKEAWCAYKATMVG